MKIDGILAVFIAGYYIRGVIFQQKSLIISIYIFFFSLELTREYIFHISRL